MKDRVLYFRQKFPTKAISQTALRNLYIKHGVRRKQVHIEKRMSTNQALNFEENRQEVIAGLKHAWDNDLPLVWLDEIVFSKTAMVKSTWTNRGVHLKTDQMDYYSGYRAAIVAVNSSAGVISY